MNEELKNKLFSDVSELLDIYKEYAPIPKSGSFNPEVLKETIIAMINFIVSNKTEAEALINWIDNTDFWTAPASTRFHGNFKSGLVLHTLKVIHQALVFAEPVLNNYFESEDSEKFSISAEDIFISALCHDFCKTNFYGIEYRNTKDINGNWVKTPCYKTKNDNRNLGHGNESVLMLLESMPSFIKKRYVLEAISRHMGFSDLSESESFNYSNFLQNPLVILLQLADETAAQWFGC